MLPIKISAVVITYNEEHCISRCINSLVRVADEIVVVDSYSTDHTVEILKKLNVKLFQRAFQGYSDQKNWGNAKAQNNWILSVDADEELSESLIESILAIKQKPEYKAYECNRYNNFCGSWVRYAGWYPDRKLRLWDKTAGCWNANTVHEDIVLEKNIPIGRLKGDLLHYTYISLGQHYQTLYKYAGLQVDRKIAKGKKLSLSYALFKFAYRFLVMYILKLGLLNGSSGLKLCFNNSLKYLFNFAIFNRKTKQEDQSVIFVSDNGQGLGVFSQCKKEFRPMPNRSMHGLFRAVKLYRIFHRAKSSFLIVRDYPSLRTLAIPAFLGGVGRIIFYPHSRSQYKGGLKDAFIFSVVSRYLLFESNQEFVELKRKVNVLDRELRSSTLFFIPENNTDEIVSVLDE